MRSQLGPHLFELLALAGLEDLNNPAQSRGAEVVELVLQALVVVAIVLQHYRDLIRLFRGEIQLGLEVLKDSFPIRVAGRRCGHNLVEPVVQSILHAQHPDCGAG